MMREGFRDAELTEGPEQTKIGRSAREVPCAPCAILLLEGPALAPLVIDSQAAPGQILVVRAALIACDDPAISTQIGYQRGQKCNTGGDRHMPVPGPAFIHVPQLRIKASTNDEVL